MVTLSAFLWCILLGKSMKRAHPASRCPARAAHLDSHARILQGVYLPDKMLSLPNLSDLLSNTAMFLHCGFCAMLSTSSQQELEHSNFNTPTEATVSVCCTLLMWTSKHLKDSTQFSSLALAMLACSELQPQKSSSILPQWLSTQT